MVPVFGWRLNLGIFSAERFKSTVIWSHRMYTRFIAEGKTETVCVEILVRINYMLEMVIGCATICSVSNTMFDNFLA